MVLFERSRNSSSKKRQGCEYKFFTEFQSHDAEFDYLKSLEIEETINKIKWLKSGTDALYLLSTNDKTIKLWRIQERQIKLVSANNLNGPNHFVHEGGGNGGAANINGISSLKLPQLELHDKLISAQPKKIYSNAHAYHINSISVNSDQETFISADDLRINLWNLGIADQSFNIVDIKPTNMEELTEVITSAKFHPSQCNLFMYSSSKGTIKLSDMRSNSLCDTHAKIFEEYSDPSSHNFFTEITSSISDVEFSANGRYIASRDYMTVKIWDLAMESKPVKTINVHEHLRDRLCDTYENDSVFDKFEVQFSGDSRSVMTGSYNNKFMIYPNVTSGEDSKTFKTSSSSSSKGRKRSKGEGNGVANNNDDDDNDNDDDDDDDNNDDDDNDDEFDQLDSPPNNKNSPISQLEDEDDQDEIILQADKSAFKSKKTGHHSSRRRMMSGGVSNLGRDYDDIDFKKNILHLSWHPRENSVAIAATNNLYIFSTL